MLLFNAPQTKVPSSAPKTHNSKLSLLSMQMDQFRMSTSAMATAEMVIILVLQEALKIQIRLLSNCMENAPVATGTGLLSTKKLNVAERFQEVHISKPATNGLPSKMSDPHDAPNL